MFLFSFAVFAQSKDDGFLPAPFKSDENLRYLPQSKAKGLFDSPDLLGYLVRPETVSINLRYVEHYKAHTSHNFNSDVCMEEAKLLLGDLSSWTISTPDSIDTDLTKICILVIHDKDKKSEIKERRLMAIVLQNKLQIFIANFHTYPYNAEIAELNDFLRNLIDNQRKLDKQN